jgi:hypothetical protein
MQGRRFVPELDSPAAATIVMAALEAAIQKNNNAFQ